MFHKITLAATLYFVVMLFTNCQNAINSEKSAKNNALLTTVLQTQKLEAANTTIANLNASQFLLNGSWNSFTGNATTSDTILTISAKSGSNGVVLLDSSGFGGFSSCNIIVQFDNSTGYYIAQNPENNGACFTGDTSKGKYFKNIFFAEGNNYWTCTIYNPVASVSEALALPDTTTRTSPGTSGCGSSPWSRIERR